MSEFGNTAVVPYSSADGIWSSGPSLAFDVSAADNGKTIILTATGSPFDGVELTASDSLVVSVPVGHSYTAVITTTVTSRSATYGDDDYGRHYGACGATVVFGSGGFSPRSGRWVSNTFGSYVAFVLIPPPAPEIPSGSYDRSDLSFADVVLNGTTSGVITTQPLESGLYHVYASLSATDNRASNHLPVMGGLSEISISVNVKIYDAAVLIHEYTKAFSATDDAHAVTDWLTYETANDTITELNLDIT